MGEGGGCSADEGEAGARCGLAGVALQPGRRGGEQWRERPGVGEGQGGRQGGVGIDRRLVVVAARKGRGARLWT